MIRPRLVIILALQNIVGQRRRSALLSALLALVAFAAVLGGTLVENVERGMQRTIVESLAGELQVVPPGSVDKLALFGDVYFGDTRLERIDGAPALAARLRQLDGVSEAVPLALRLASFSQPSAIDAAIERLRTGFEQADDVVMTEAEQHLRWAAERLLAQLKDVADGALGEGELERRRDIARRVLSPQLWETWRADPPSTLMFLDASFAPLFGEATPLFLHLIGTDSDAFARAFPRFEVVRGRALRAGEPAFTVSESTFEAVRHQYLVRLDQLAKLSAASAAPLPPARVHALQEAAPALVEQLTREQAALLRTRLCTQVDCAAAASLTDVLVSYADVDHATVAERQRFLDEVALQGLPRGLLVIGHRYTVSMADDAGRPRSTLLELVGSYRVRGLDEAPVEIAALTNAASFARMDDSDRAPEQVSARAVAPAFDPSETDALFLSGDAPTSAPVATGGFDEFAAWSGGADDHSEPAFELERWSAQTIALRVQGADIERVRAAARELLGSERAAPLIVVDGFAVAGPIAHAVPILKGIFTGVLALLLLLAFGVIANALVLSWLRRVRELGTLRALGATRSLVWAALLMEASVLAAIGAVVGIALASAVILALGWWGIPAPDPIFEFIFGGPTLRPVVVWEVLPLGASVLLLALAASVYPAWRATRATPREAMEVLP